MKKGYTHTLYLNRGTTSTTHRFRVSSDAEAISRAEVLYGLSLLEDPSRPELSSWYLWARGGTTEVAHYDPRAEERRRAEEQWERMYRIAESQ